MGKANTTARRKTRAGAYLVPWLKEALTSLGGSGTVTDVCREISRAHGRDLPRLGDAAYTWQYDVRWAAFLLREGGEARFRREGRNTVWELVPSQMRRGRRGGQPADS